MIAMALPKQLFLIKYRYQNDLIHSQKQSISIKDIKSYIQPLFLNKNIVKIGYHIKKAFYFLDQLNIPTNPPYEDIKLASYLIKPSQQNNALDDIFEAYLPDEKVQLKSGDIDEKKGALIGQKGYQILKLHPILHNKLIDFELDKLYYQIEIPLIHVLYKMEKYGIKLDILFLKNMSQEFAVNIDQLKESIFRLSGETFNINSPKQLSKILFEKLKLPVIKKTKTGYSTNVQVLNKLASQHDIVNKLLQYRELEKLKNTYIDKLPKLVSPETKRIHTTFEQTATSTGRLSSRNPNLQNIPIRTNLGKNIRNAFIADNHDILLSADYSQIELRILAHMSHDQQLLTAFKEGRDIHTHTAAQLFNIDENIISQELRRIAKSINFGIIYGMSAFGLAENLGINQDEAQKYIEAYFQQYNKVKEYIDQQLILAREKKYVKTLMNRIRYLDGINSENRRIREFNERIAINAPIQGTAADLIKIAMINIVKAYHQKREKCGLILQIHDELIFEIPFEEQEKHQAWIKQIMENCLQLDVPLEINFKTGKKWGNFQ